MSPSASDVSRVATGPASDDTPIDPVAVQRHVRRLLAAPAAPWLHEEVSRRMVERLQLIKLRPRTVVQWAARLGGSQAGLEQTYPEARHLWVEHSAVNWPRLSLMDRLRGRQRPDVFAPAELPAGSGELVWANMVLHGSAAPAAMMKAWVRALAVDGFVMFSCLGPDSFRELRPLFAQAGWGPTAPPWIDMHDLGDDLVQAGFADPVMDQERLTLTWETPERLLEDLRAIGGNVARDRFAGLRTPAWRSRLLAALHGLRGSDGLLRMSVELVYGHAFKPVPKVRLAAETHVSLDQMREMVRSKDKT